MAVPTRTPPAARPVTTAPLQRGGLLPTAPTTNGGARPAKTFSLGGLIEPTAWRIVGYGEGGVGKTSLFARAPGPVAVIDLDDGLRPLTPTLTGVDVKPVDGIQTWEDLRAALHSPELFKGVRTIVVDSATRAEALAVAHVLKTVAHEKGGTVTSIEGYGYGKGYRHVYETFMQLLADLDRHHRAGRNVCLIAHDCTANVPNPEGTDYIRWEPRLQNQGNGNIRLAVKEWCDHLLCIRQDVAVTKDGKAQGQGTRTIYPIALPTHMAKSRTLREAIPFEEGSRALWEALCPAKG